MKKFYLKHFRMLFHALNIPDKTIIAVTVVQEERLTKVSTAWILTDIELMVASY